MQDFASFPILIIVAIIVAISLIIFVWHNKQDEKRFCAIEKDIEKIKDHLDIDHKEELADARRENGSIPTKEV